MSKQSREDYYKTVVKRYKNSDKKTKSHVLDEFCEVCGYNRFDKVAFVEELNQIYTSEWRLFMNFFRPSSKLQKKVRIIGKVKKVYDSPKTPYQRLLKSDKISDAEKEKLKSQFESLNPIKLQTSMVTKIKQFINKTTSIFEESKSTAFN